MAFKFSLAAVLKYREELEKREERALEQRRETLAGLQKQLAEIDTQRDQLIATRFSSLQSGTVAADLHYIDEQERRLEQLQAQVRSQVAAALVAYEEQMKVFLSARQKREILDELKSTQKDIYIERQDRREQQQIDEMFGGRVKRDK